MTGKQLQKVRQRLGKTQMQIAFQSGVSIPTIQAMEAGRHVSLRIAAQLAPAYEVDVSEIPQLSAEPSVA